jgi:hypothetical protein
VLSKETMLLAVPGVIVALWQGSDPTTRTFSLAAFFSGLTLVGVMYPLFAVLKGELIPGPGHVSLVGAMLFQVHNRAGSGSIFTSGSGANALLHSWLYYDVVLVAGGAASVAVGLLSRRLRAPALAGLAFVVVAMRPGGYLPAMYVIQALPFFALALAGIVATVGHWILLHGPDVRLRVPRFRFAAGIIATVGRRIRPRRPDLRVRVRPFRLAIAVAVSGLALGLVVPRWVDGDRRALTVDDNRDVAAAGAWLRANVPDPQHARVVVDDALWLDMVRHGFAPGLGAVWFYKLDLDPAVQRELPGGWRDVDYLVSTPIVRQDSNTLPTVADLLSHSRTVATFGDGPGRIEIRKVNETE